MTEAKSETALRRDTAYALHKSGKIAEAINLYNALLKEEPGNADILGLVAMAQHQLGNKVAAIDAWKTSFKQQCAAQIQLRNANNYLTSLVQDNSASELQAPAEILVPEWPNGEKPVQSDMDMILSLARGLVHVGRKPDALKLLESVLALVADDASFVRQACRIMLDAGFAERVNVLLRSMTQAALLADGDLLLLRAASEFACGNQDESFGFTLKAVEALPAVVTDKKASQTLLLGVLNNAPKRVMTPTSPQEFHFSENSPASLAGRFNDQYRFMSIFPEASTAPAALANLPSPDIIINNWVNAEQLSTSHTLEFISEFADSLGRPVLNHPRKAVNTTRQRNAILLAGIPNLVVPRIVRFLNRPEDLKSIVRLIRNDIGFPAIVRDPFMQMGMEAFKLDTPRQLEKYLSSRPGQELYGIEFVHNPAADGVYRKIRAAVIGDEIIISHVHLALQWNVHRERDEERLKEISANQSAVEFADRIMQDPVATLGRAAFTTLTEIRKKIPLELYGIDFDEMPDGRLVFFEANAAMNISFGGRKGMEAIRIKMREALHQLFENTRGR